MARLEAVDLSMAFTIELHPGVRPSGALSVGLVGEDAGIQDHDRTRPRGQEDIAAA